MHCQMFLLLLLHIHSVSSTSKEGALYEHLLQTYISLERPVANSSEPVTVRMGIVLQQIVDVDEKNQVVDVNAWLKLSWHDYSLEWNPEDWGGVNNLRFRKGQLWNPDVLMYNSADPKFDSSFASNLLVYPNGMVNWIPPGLFRLSCRIEVVWFPFDVQECFMKFGSWTFDGSKLDLQVDQSEGGFDISNYMPNGEWHLISTRATRNIQYYQCCPEPYYDIIFTFVLRRRVLYYGFNLILPCILITLLTLIGFTMPPDAGEKMSLQITIMLSICIFQNYVAEMSPPTSEAVPFLGAFFAVCMFTCACCVTATTLALNFHHRNRKSHEMSELFRKVMLNWLPWLLCMYRPGYVAIRGNFIKEEEDLMEITKPDICLRNLLSSISIESPVLPFKFSRIDEESTPTLSDPSTSTGESSTPPPSGPQHLWRNKRSQQHQNKIPTGQIAQLLTLQQMYHHLTAIKQVMCTKELDKAMEDDWKFAALVVDRFCLIIFSLFILFSTVTLFASVPNLTSHFLEMDNTHI